MTKQSGLKIPNWKFCTALFAAILLLQSPLAANALPITPPNKFPRTANIYLSTIQKSDYETLASYDLLVLIPEIQHYNPNFFAYARSRNPNIIILPYIYSAQVNIQGQDDIYSDLKRAFVAIATPERFLYSPERAKINIWNNIIFAMNVSTDWVEVMPRVMKEKVLSTQLWDGIFYDVVDSSVTHYNDYNIDIDNDGIRDDPAMLNQRWQEGMTKLLKNTRELIGADKYIVINGDSLPAYQLWVNGRMFESFPTPWEGKGRWMDSINSYFALPMSNFRPPISIINTNTRDQGNERNWRQMRFGLTSTLLSDGFSSFDFGPTSHAQLWKYDEYDAVLGRSVSPATNALALTDTTLNDSVWRRDFEHGATFVNATPQEKTLLLEEEFERLHGIQDPSVNDGSISNEVKIAANDGVLVLRPIDRIVGSPYLNGSFVRVFTNKGVVKRTGFFTYRSSVQGRATVAELLPNEHERTQFIVAEGQRLLFAATDGSVIASVLPYGERFRGTFTFALVKINNDDQREIITIPTSGGSAHVRSFTLEGKPSAINFIAATPTRRGGSIAVIRRGRATPPLVALGASIGERPIIKLFSTNGKLVNQWGAFEGSFTGGMSVAAADIDGSGNESLVVGRSSRGRPEVRIFNIEGKLLGLFHAFDARGKNGVNVIANDIDGDGKSEIIATSTQIFTVAGKTRP